uniref:Uncharacterized protein n=1 Tax=Arundo donax TaxID=35708 RepID=A0A0A9H0Z8_ARUDO
MCSTTSENVLRFLSLQYILVGYL